jgi:MFS family permease
MHDAGHYVMELYFGSMILSPFLGSLIDKIGQRPLLAFFSLIAMAAAYAAVIWLPFSLFSSFGFYSLSAAIFYSTLYPMLPLTATSTAYYSHNFAINTCVSNLVLFARYYHTLHHHHSLILKIVGCV